MPPIDPLAEHSTGSPLKRTLHRLQRHLEANRHREQAALELFGTWQTQWTERREMIAQQMEFLDQELSRLAISAMPVPPVSLLSLSDVEDEEGSSAETAADTDDECEGVISLAENPWKIASPTSDH